jgi:alanine racemase
MQGLTPDWSAIPVLKSNAYGHGLALVAGIFEKEAGIPFFALDSYFEARVLRDAGVTKPLLILGHTPSESIEQNSLSDVVFAVASVEQLKNLHEKNVGARIHLKFDTGMHRQGIVLDRLDEVVTLVQGGGGLIVEGIFSHLADAETVDSALTRTQIERWNVLAARFRKECPGILWFHLANSAGFAHADAIDANAGRTGIALYGINPGNLPTPLVPALSMESCITEIRTIVPGERVGYNGTFTAKRITQVATVPIGYFEGVDRRLSNVGSYLVAGKPALILGRVSMNISSCDVTDIPAVGVGEMVVIVSGESGDPNSAESIARLTDTIPYEVLVRIPAHLQRVVEP